MPGKKRYAGRNEQRIYETMLLLAADPTSELYCKGEPRRGAGHRNAFWDGFHKVTRSPQIVRGTRSWICYQAGKEWARQQRLTNVPKQS